MFATWTDGQTCNKASHGRCITDPSKPLGLRDLMALSTPLPAPAKVTTAVAAEAAASTPLTPIISAPDMNTGGLTLQTRYFIVYDGDTLVTVVESSNLSAAVLEPVLRYGRTYEYYVLDISTTDEVIAAAGPGYYTTPAKPDGVDDYGNPLVTQGLKSAGGQSIPLADAKLATLVTAGTGLSQAALLSAIQGAGGIIKDLNERTLATMNTNDVHVVRSNGGQGKELVLAASETSTLATIKPLTAAGYAMDASGVMKSSPDVIVNAAGINLPLGLLDFSIVLDPDANSTNVVIVPPTPFAPGTKWYKVTTGGTLKEYPNFVVDASGNGILTLFDNDEYDQNPAWSVIRDPGGPGTPAAAGDGGGCFIATAAYGSYLDPHVRVLRDFRDAFLLTNSAGRALVRFYYRVSPPIADFIKGNAALRATTRIALTPVVYTIEYPLGAGSILLLLVTIAARTRRRPGKGYCCS
jgi:hypothetical protein